jgi:hypothetical protein
MKKKFATLIQKKNTMHYNDTKKSRDLDNIKFGEERKKEVTFLNIIQTIILFS